MGTATHTNVSCSRCGQRWAMDPALMVACPTCQAPIGSRCKRPSGHVIPGGGIHADRDLLAMKIIPGYGRCPGSQEEASEGGD